MIGTTEILIIAGVVVLLFGASAIPKFSKAIGKAKREFQKGMQEGEKEEEDEPEAEDGDKKPGKGGRSGRS